MSTSNRLRRSPISLHKKIHVEFPCALCLARIVFRGQGEFDARIVGIHAGRSVGHAVGQEVSGSGGQEVRRSVGQEVSGSGGQWVNGSVSLSVCRSVGQ